MNREENALGDLSCDMGDGAFPGTFDVDKNFHEYVSKMEQCILAKEGTYDPDDKSFPPPVPISERLLPGLCVGKGGFQYTHTKQKGIEHRLLCLLSDCPHTPSNIQVAATAFSMHGG